MITHKWINLTELTPAITRYEDFFRFVCTLAPIEILRNHFEISDGLYIVGDQPHIKEAEDLIREFIKKVERNTKHKTFKPSRVHLSEQRANYRISLIAKYLVNLKPFSIDLNSIEASTHKILRKEYIQNTSLKNLKPYNARK